MPKFCEYCGTPLKEGAKFCVGCGHSVAQAAQPANQNMNNQRAYAPQTPNVNPMPTEPYPNAQPTPMSPQTPAKKDNTLLIIMLAIAAVLIVIKLI